MGTDPFGREVEEDPLKSMGWTTSEGAPATVEPGAEVAEPPGDGGFIGTMPSSAPAPTPSSVVSSGGDGFIGTMPQSPPAYSPSSSPRTIRVGRGGGRFIGLLVVLAFIGIPAAFVIPPIISAINAVDEATKPFRDGNNPIADPSRIPEAPGKAKPGKPPRGLSRTSLLLRGNLSPALKRLKSVTDGNRVVSLRVDADSVHAQVLFRGRLQLASADTTSARVWARSPAPGSRTTMRWSDINASAPRRIVEAVTVKRGRKSASFDYVVLFKVPTRGLQWTGFRKGGDGPYVSGRDGTNVRKVG